MTLGSRLSLGLFAIALVLTIPLALALNALDELQSETEGLSAGGNVSLLIGRIQERASEMRAADDRLVILLADSTSARYRDELLMHADSIAAAAETIRANQLPTLARQMAATAQTVRQYAPLEFAAAEDSVPTLAEAFSRDQIVPAIDSLERELETAAGILRDLAIKRVEDARDAAEDAKHVAGLLLVIGGLCALLISIWLTRSVSRPVRDLEQGMKAVASGEFFHRLSVAPSRKDEFGRLATSYTAMAEQLAELDKVKAEFVSIASHELKTPINVILGYLQLLGEQVYGPLNEKQLDVLNTLETQADSLGRLVQHLLDVSRFQAGEAKLEPKELALHPFLDELDQTFRVLALQRDVDFSVAARGPVPEQVWWDVDRVNEVLGNLLANAFKFTPAGGHVDLMVTAVGERVYIEVRDSGAGIAPAQLPHIFDKFYQADNQEAAATKGSGLGLAIAKEIVEAHGGTIAVESVEGEGTTFSIMLPTRATQPMRAVTTADGVMFSAQPLQEEAVVT
jgi:signal transduction histidine kinase